VSNHVCLAHFCERLFEQPLPSVPNNGHEPLDERAYHERELSSKLNESLIDIYRSLDRLRERHYPEAQPIGAPFKIGGVEVRPAFTSAAAPAIRRLASALPRVCERRKTRSLSGMCRARLVLLLSHKETGRSKGPVQEVAARIVDWRDPKSELARPSRGRQRARHARVKGSDADR
jgi:hypothetical protein